MYGEVNSIILKSGLHSRITNPLIIMEFDQNSKIILGFFSVSDEGSIVREIRIIRET